MGNNAKNAAIILVGFAVIVAVGLGAARLLFGTADLTLPFAMLGRSIDALQQHDAPAPVASTPTGPDVAEEPAPPPPPPPPPPAPEAPSPAAPERRTAPVDPGASFMRSTVFLVFKDGYGEDAIRGSGFVVDRGIVVTNYKLVMGTSLDPVTRGGETPRSPDAIVLSGGSKRYQPKEVLLADLSWDVAFLWVPDLDAPPLELAAEALPAEGAPIVTAASPHVLEARFKSGRVLGSSESSGLRIVELDVPILPILRGAPVVDASGRAVGMTVLDRPEIRRPGYAFSALDLARLLPMARANIPAK